MKANFSTQPDNSNRVTLAYARTHMGVYKRLKNTDSPVYDYLITLETSCSPGVMTNLVCSVSGGYVTALGVTDNSGEQNDFEPVDYIDVRFFTK
jgi:hypothetical protein